MRNFFGAAYVIDDNHFEYHLSRDRVSSVLAYIIPKLLPRLSIMDKILRPRRDSTAMFL